MVLDSLERNFVYDEFLDEFMVGDMITTVEPSTQWNQWRDNFSLGIFNRWRDGNQWEIHNGKKESNCLHIERNRLVDHSRYCESCYAY